MQWFFFNISLQPVKGLYVWCQGCGHGGHLQHLKDWFDGNSLCPTAGCGHICTLSSWISFHNYHISLFVHYIHSNVNKSKYQAITIHFL